jgi:outer membrane protein insertion porin family
MKFNKFILTIIVLVWHGLAYAADDFIVRDIEFKGLHKVSVGTVLNYLPIEVGQKFSSTQSSDIIRSLYNTQFFQEVSIAEHNDTLIITVVERPTIAAITLTGNHDITDDKMQGILKDLNLVDGHIFQNKNLEILEKELKKAYNARGKYNVIVTSKVTSLKDNRVSLSITISEGRVARIKEIKFIGVHAMTVAQLRSRMTLTTSGILTYFNKADQYSKNEMAASLDAIRNFYLDEGYLKFNIVSSQVLLSPDKKDVFIEIHIEEGAQYKFSGFSIAGDLVLPKKELENLVLFKEGDIFSRKEITESVTNITLALGDKGYGFPIINPEPNIDEANKTVFIAFIINPGQHVYVRRIKFHGNTRTADYVFRNVFNQDEAALLSLNNIKESERRLKNLTFVKNVDVKTLPVPGISNQVDIDVNLEETSSAQASLQLGYGSTGPQAGISFKQPNFMGNGRAVGLTANVSYWGQDYNASYFDPFYAPNGVGMGFDVYYRMVDPKNIDISNYSSDRIGGDITYSIPLGEKVISQLGYGYQGLHINSTGSVQQTQNFVNEYGDDFQELRLFTGVGRNNYDRSPFPTEGSNQLWNFILDLPLNAHSLSYYKTSYQFKNYQPLWRDFIFMTFIHLSYGNNFDATGLPFFENYYAGGISQPGGQVRGYETYSLGPHDSNGNALGGNAMSNGTISLIFPYPVSNDIIRSSIFLDAGNVYSFGAPNNLSGTNTGPLRYAAGLSVEWLSPFGAFAFSVATPLNAQLGDREQFFQFAASSTF